MIATAGATAVIPLQVPPCSVVGGGDRHVRCESSRHHARFRPL